MAQEWTERCIWGYNVGRTSLAFDYVGENIYSTSGHVDVVKGISVWHDEIADYNYTTNTCDAFCEHYTQVADEVIQH